MRRAFGRQRAKIAFEIAAARRLDEMHRHPDAGLLHQPMVERVVADAVLRRAIDGFERPHS